MHTSDLRSNANQCLERAQALLASSEEPSVRYASLELRFAIEYITYSQVQGYLKELADDAVKKWTPKSMIEDLLDADETADKSVRLAVGVEPAYGVRAEVMRDLCEDRRLRKKEAVSHYNALGNFVHAPSLYQLESAAVPALSTMRDKAVTIAAELERILESRVFNVNMGNTIHFDCVECHAPLLRKVDSVKRDGGLVCRNSNCRAIYDITEDDNGRFTAALRMTPYVCELCKTTQGIPTYKVALGTQVTCACGAERVISLCLAPITSRGPDK